MSFISWMGIHVPSTDEWTVRASDLCQWVCPLGVMDAHRMVPVAARGIWFTVGLPFGALGGVEW
jgi:hypothetical protein